VQLTIATIFGKPTLMQRAFGALIVATALGLSTTPAQAEAEIVVAIRYLQAEGTSHSHLYLYREDGKLLRQLTNDNSGQDVDPIFAPDGETIVFTREMPNGTRQFWTLDPHGTRLKKLDTAPEWYTATKSSPYFTTRQEQQSVSLIATPEKETQPPIYKAPDGSVALVLQTFPSDKEDGYDGPGHGKHYLLLDLKSKTETEMGKLPGFFGLFELLHDSQNKDRQFLFDGSLRVAFFGLHLDSTAGDTSFALDLNGTRRLVRLSPNWAAPIPIPGEPMFLTLTENRYVPIPGTSKTANCSYLERWDTKLSKVRYAREGSAAICYGASMYRPKGTPPTVIIRMNPD
jgi:hypothetical protein